MALQVFPAPLAVPAIGRIDVAMVDPAPLLGIGQRKFQAWDGMTVKGHREATIPAYLPAAPGSHTACARC